MLKKLQEALARPGMKLALVFALEGLLVQFGLSVKAFGNNLFATNLGATDTQIGLIQTIGCGVTIAFLLPSGILSDRCRSSKTMTVVLLALGGLMFLLQALVPWMGRARLVMFFVFVGLSSGMLGAYNGQWQAMFGDLVEMGQRNRVYALRSRVMAALGVIVPILCGVAMSNQNNSEAKMVILSVFFCISGVLMFLQAFVVARIPGGMRTPEQMAAMEKFTLKNLGEAVRTAVRNKPFLSFVLASMFLYMAWHVDWSIWYIAQVQYIGLTEAQLSYYNAICCIAQIVAMSVLVRINQKRGSHFTVCIGACGLAMYPLYMQLILRLPAGMRPWFFICLCTTACMLECGVSLSMIQMMLDVVPEKHRSLTISLYTALTTLSNCIMPLLGVRAYTLLGADMRALRIFFAGVLVWRSVAAALYLARYRRIQKQKVTD